MSTQYGSNHLNCCRKFHCGDGEGGLSTLSQLGSKPEGGARDEDRVAQVRKREELENVPEVFSQAVTVLVLDSAGSNDVPRNPQKCKKH